ncbi:MAG: hypothetical protein GY927_09670 [bacterium]|nr:hypothetical protein [bacterium]
MTPGDPDGGTRSSSTAPNQPQQSKSYEKRPGSRSRSVAGAFFAPVWGTVGTDSKRFQAVPTMEVTMTTQHTPTTWQVVAIGIGSSLLAVNAAMNVRFMLGIGSGWDQIAAILTATIAAAGALTLAEYAWQEKQRMKTLGFLTVFILGTSISVLASMSRTATTSDAHTTRLQSQNMGLTLARDALVDARRDYKSFTNDAARECASGIGPKCRAWRTKADDAQGRIDRARAKLEAAGAQVVVDPVGSRLEQAGIISARNYAVYQPMLLPFMLEFGSLFLAFGFCRRRDAFRQELEALSDKEMALQWYRAQIARGNQPKVVDLASMAGVHKSTASRWLSVA